MPNEILFYTQNKMYPLSKATCKMFYVKLVNCKARVPSCVKKWAEDYPEFKTASDTIWSGIFKIPFMITRETKLQSFQYQIIHRLITCKKRLVNMKITDNPKCDFCKDIDDIRHFFLFCPKVNAFWNSFFQWWNNLTDIKISFNYENLEECILFGFPIEGDVFEVLNYCILVAKFYIYRQRLFNDNDIDLFSCLVELKYNIKIEYGICKNNNTLDKFEKYLFLYEQL